MVAGQIGLRIQLVVLNVVKVYNCIQGRVQILRTFVAATTHLRFTKSTYYVFCVEEAMRSQYT